MKYIDIQDKLLKQYPVTLCDGTMCIDDWSRTHAHKKEKKVCKWIRKNSVESTFELAHEIGHIYAKHGSGGKRFSEEFYATEFAVTTLTSMGVTIPDKTLTDYKDYILMEWDRGYRRSRCKTGFFNDNFPCRKNVISMWDELIKSIKTIQSVV